ncbi:MAG: hypothetical protein PHD87_09180 [Candidatus Cloacimonetes bacterium]|nr:hypothetical protein [Candidatus Cloacimonadota bacterium]
MKATVFSLALALVLCAGSLHADLAVNDLILFEEATGNNGQRTTNNWLGSISTDWHDAANWSLGHVPTSLEDVSINNCDDDPPVCSQAANCNDLLVDLSGGLILTGGYVWARGNANVRSTLTFDWNGSGLDPRFQVDGDLLFDGFASVNMLHPDEDSGRIQVQGDLTFDDYVNVNIDKGHLIMLGNGNSQIRVFYPTTIRNFVSAKNSPYYTDLYNIGFGNLTITDLLEVQEGSTLKQTDDFKLILQGDLEVQPGAVCQLDNGLLSMEGIASAYLRLGDPGNYLNDLDIEKTGTFAYTVTLYSDLALKDDLTLRDGVLETKILGYPSNFYYDIALGGDWHNYAGPAAFHEYSANSVTLNGSENQTVWSETFSNLILDKPSGEMSIINCAVVCSCFDWEQGGYSVNGGSFTANSLADNGIFGDIHLSGTINYYQGTEATDYVDLNAHVTMDSGTFNVYGGGQPSRWAWAANASLEMVSGYLNFHNVGVLIDATGYSFSETITDGRIRIAGSFTVLNSSFTPEGGDVYLNGANNSSILLASGSCLHDLVIYIPDETTLTAMSDLDINGDFKLLRGIFVAPNVMNVAGDWFNQSGATDFIEGTGKVVFDSNLDSVIFFAEDFCQLELAKDYSFREAVIGGGIDVSCQSYDWTEGRLRINGGTFTALDLADPGVKGIFHLQDGTVDLNQDAAQAIDLLGEVSVEAGVFQIRGGSGTSRWPYSEDASLTLSGGTLDVTDQAIRINASSYSLASAVSGGIIRCSKGFAITRSDFQPTGGTVELYGGNSGSILSCAAGSWFHHLLVNKADPSTSVLSSSVIPVKGNLDISQGTLLLSTAGYLNVPEFGTTTIAAGGTLNLGDRYLNSTGDVVVNGTLRGNAGSGLYLRGGQSLTVNSGGELILLGSQSEPVTVSRSNTGGYYAFTIASGAAITAHDAIFEYMDANGVYIDSGATVGESFTFGNCVFRYGEVTAQGGALLTVRNSQNLSITGASFPILPDPLTGRNVSKPLNQGSLEFLDWSGDFGGAGYENDPYGRVSWEGGGLPPVQNLSIAYSGGQISLDWDYSETVDHFNIYRAADPAGTFTLHSSSATTSWSEAVPGPLYFYRVTAVGP